LPGEDEDYELFNGEGKMVARIRQEGECWWVAHPRKTRRLRRSIRPAPAPFTWPSWPCPDNLLPPGALTGYVGEPPA
jgi:hypothetical protein